MKVCVCVKAVASPAGGTTLVDKGRIRRIGSVQVNAPDIHAIEAALGVSELVGSSDVVLLSMAPEDGIDALRHGLAMGASRAVLVTGSELEGSDLIGTSKVLASLIQREQPDLTLFGWEATDANGAMLWSAVGARVQLPVVSRAWRMSLEGEGLRATRQMEYGLDEVVAPLPCIVAISGAINTPRYPSMKGIIASKRAPIEVLSCAELGLNPEDVGWRGSRTTVLEMSLPPTRSAGEVVEDDGQGARWLLERLIRLGLVTS